MTVIEGDFRPRWASPPGDSIRSSLDQLDWDLSKLAAELDISDSAAAGLLDGSTPVSIDLARGLSGVLGGSPRFWITRDARYREALDWIAADEWVSLLNLRDMVDFGWVEPSASWHERVSTQLSFFGASSPRDLLERRASSPERRYRAKPTNEQQRARIAAWVRRVEVEAAQIECGEWKPNGLRALLPDLAALSRISDPTVFVPEMTRLAATVGVSVVVVRAPKGCPVSGVSAPTDSGTRIIGLSGRYLSDDHLWFTFFHEAAHLLLHDEGTTFVDEISNKAETPTDPPEVEADAFAAGVLLPDDIRRTIRGRPTPISIHGLARQAKVSPGVVVGQLQHIGAVPYRSRLNQLKRRFKWDGTTLIRGSG